MKIAEIAEYSLHGGKKRIVYPISLPDQLENVISQLKDLHNMLITGTGFKTSFIGELLNDKGNHVRRIAKQLKE